MKKKRNLVFLLSLLVLIMIPTYAHAMHIMEGFLPVKHAIAWSVISLPFILIGGKKVSKITKNNKEIKLILGMAAAFTFVLSALKFPSVTGSCSHPTGIAFGAILFGPFVMVVLGLLVLIFQAVLLAHGGLTTLGANTFSMAIVGAFVAFGVYRLLKDKFKVNKSIAVFFAAFLGDLLTYVCTSVQLALAHPDAVSGFMGSFTKFATVFAVTQLPLAIVEGLITVVAMNLIEKYAEEEVLVIEGGLN